MGQGRQPRLQWGAPLLAQWRELHWWEQCFSERARGGVGGQVFAVLTVCEWASDLVTNASSAAGVRQVDGGGSAVHQGIKLAARPVAIGPNQPLSKSESIVEHFIC